MALTAFTLLVPFLPAASQALTPEELVAEVRALVEQRAAEERFSGAVLVARGDEVLLTLAVGEADRGWHVPNGVETRFNLGSMNKMFTGIAVAQLAERGALAFDDPIAKWVDASWLPRALTEKVTVRHLLTHTSGLGSYFNDVFMQSSRALFRAVDDYKPLVQGETLAFEPGTRFQYSNTGMLLLGVVIEKASGQDYFAYVREHVHAPTGMTRTDCYELDQPVEDLAVGYERDPTAAGGWRNNLFQHVMRGGPAGGGYSTVGDLHRFARALLAGELVGVETLDLLWTDAVGADYGCGFSVVDAPQKIVGHSGGFPGISANLDVFVETGWVVAVLANQGGAAMEVSRAIRERVLRVAE
jgi:CubicO group peptidase (beta-lactamase class C family)